MRTRTKFPPLCRHMLQILSGNISNKSQIKQVSSLAEPAHSNSSTDRIPPTRIDFSSIDCTGIAKDVILKCPHIFGRKEKPFPKASLKDLLLDVSDVIPEISRKFRRVSSLKSEDVLEILLGFEFEAGKVALGARKVETLWEIFKWACDQGKDFEHLPRSCEVMASLLIRAGLLRKVELLFLAMEMQGVRLGSHKIFNDLIEAYLANGDLGKALILFEKMREQNLVPSLSCFHAFIDALVQRKRTQLAFQLCLHMVEMSVNLSNVEKPSLENVIRLLCLDGRIQEVRSLLKFMPSSFEPSTEVVNNIALGYCKKKDFEDLLRFLFETRCLPDLTVCNKIIHTLCCDFSVERANLFRQELEHLGFSSNETTFGILLGWSCHRGNLRSAFLYLSEILALGLKPDIFSYNAVISGVFKEGLWNLAQDILDEMVDSGTKPNLSTFEVLLAGYCKARRFEEAKMTVLRMVDLGLVKLLSPQDPLSQAFTVLGFSPLAVRLRRDNHIGFSRAEVCDSLGNGLYLDTDLDEYDERLDEVLKEHVIPDFNSQVVKECSKGNFRTALRIVDKMVSWGQELSLPVCSSLIKGHSASLSQMKAITCLLEKMPNLADRLDQEILNLIVQAYCKKGWAYKGSKIFYEMLQRDLTIKNETYTALIKGLSNRGISKELRECWVIAMKNEWVPALNDYKVLLQCLFHQDMLEEALEIFEKMILSYPYLRPEACHLFIKELCDNGLPSVAHVLVEMLLKRHCILDPMIYSHLTRALCKDRKKSDAMAILDIMVCKNLSSSLGVSVNTIPRLHRANGFHKELMVEDTSLKAQSVFSSVQDALAEGFCTNRKVGGAYNYFRLMLLKDLLPDVHIYDIVFEVHCQANNVRKSKELLCVMIKSNVNLSMSVYRNWVRLMCNADRHTSAFGMKDFVLRQSQSSSLIFYNILVFHLLSVGNSSAVAKILNELQDKGLLPDEVTYNFLVYGFSQCGDMLSSVHYLFTMIYKGLRPNNRSLKIVINWLFRIGDLKKAFELSLEMELRGWLHCSVVQDAVAGTLLGQGKIREAETYLNRMVDKGLTPDTINYDNLIRKLCSCGRMNKAVDLLNIMLKKRNLPNLASYESLVHGFCRYNELNRAMDFHNEMLDWGIEPSIKTWDMLVLQFCQEGRIAEAEELLVSMVCSGQTPSRQMYTNVIEQYRSENNLKKVSEIVQKMQQSGYQPDFNTHWSLVRNLTNSRDGKSSEGFLSRLLSRSGFVSKNTYKT